MEFKLNAATMHFRGTGDWRRPDPGSNVQLVRRSDIARYLRSNRVFAVVVGVSVAEGLIKNAAARIVQRRPATCTFGERTNERASNGVTKVAFFMS